MNLLKILLKLDPSRLAVAGTGLLALAPSSSSPDRGPYQPLYHQYHPLLQALKQSPGLAGLDSEAVRRWVAEATRTVTKQHQAQPSGSSSSSIGPNQSTTPMTQSPSMHLLENNDLVEAMVAQHRQHLAQQQSSSPPAIVNNNNNNCSEAKLDVWRSIQAASAAAATHQWWNSLQARTTSPPTAKAPQAQVQGDQPLDFSVAAARFQQHQQLRQPSKKPKLGQQQHHQKLEQHHQKLEQHQARLAKSSSVTVRERIMATRALNNNNNNNNNGAQQQSGKVRAQVRKGRARSAGFGSPMSDMSCSGSEDEGVSTGGSPAGGMKIEHNGE